MDLRYQQCYHNYFPNTAQFDVCMGETVYQIPNKVITNTKIVNEINKKKKEILNKSKSQEFAQQEKLQEQEKPIEELSYLIKTKEEKQRMGLFQTLRFLYFHFLVANIDNLLKFTLLILILLLGQHLYYL